MKKKTTRTQYTLLHLLIIALVVVMLGRGIEGLLDTYLFPESEILSDIASIVIALGLIGAFKLHVKELE